MGIMPEKLQAFRLEICVPKDISVYHLVEMLEARRKDIDNLTIDADDGFFVEATGATTLSVIYSITDALSLLGGYTMCEMKIIMTSSVAGMQKDDQRSATIRRFMMGEIDSERIH